MKRYIVQAKRRNTKEHWSEWTRVVSWDDGARHAAHVEALGYLARIVMKGE